MYRFSLCTNHLAKNHYRYDCKHRGYLRFEESNFGMVMPNNQRVAIKLDVKMISNLFVRFYRGIISKLIILLYQLLYQFFFSFIKNINELHFTFKCGNLENEPIADPGLETKTWFFKSKFDR